MSPVSTLAATTAEQCLNAAPDHRPGVLETQDRPPVLAEWHARRGCAGPKFGPAA
jgi:hypothetical protein